MLAYIRIDRYFRIWVVKLLEWLRSRVGFGIAAWGFAATFAAFIGFVLSLAVSGSITISANVFILIVSIVIFVTFGLFSYALLADRSVQFTPPKIFRYFNLAGDDTLLADNANWLGESSTCSVYFADGDIEILLGFGFVLTKQQNQKIQIRILRHIEGTEGQWQSIRKNEGLALTAVILKPGVPKEAFDG